MARPAEDVKEGRDAAPVTDVQSNSEPQADKAVSTSTAEGGVRALEMRYMELLEKRIADLEAKLEEAEKVCCKPVAL